MQAGTFNLLEFPKNSSTTSTEVTETNLKVIVKTDLSKSKRSRASEPEVREVESLLPQRDREGLLDRVHESPREQREGLEPTDLGQELLDNVSFQASSEEAEGNAQERRKLEVDQESEQDQQKVGGRVTFNVFAKSSSTKSMKVSETNVKDS